MSEVKWSN